MSGTFDINAFAYPLSIMCPVNVLYFLKFGPVFSPVSTMRTGFTVQKCLSVCLSYFPAVYSPQKEHSSVVTVSIVGHNYETFWMRIDVIFCFFSDIFRR